YALWRAVRTFRAARGVAPPSGYRARSVGAVCKTARHEGCRNLSFEELPAPQMEPFRPIYSEGRRAERGHVRRQGDCRFTIACIRPKTQIGRASCRERV